MDLHSSCEKGNYESVLKILQKSTSNINKLYGSHRVQKTPLHHACEYGHSKIVKLLIDYGADINQKSSDKRTCLHYACLGGHNELLKYLISLFHDINEIDINGQTALHIACYHGEDECVKTLINFHGEYGIIETKVDYKLRDRNGKNACEAAVMTDQKSVLKVFLNNPTCGDIITQTNSLGETILHTSAKYNSIQCIILLKKSPVYSKINIPDQKGMLPCHHAGFHGNIDALQLLLEDNSQIQSVDNKLRTIGHYASLSGSVSCLHWLLCNGADTQSKDVDGNTMMHFSGKSSSCGELVNCLASNGACFDVENNDGETPMMKARKYGHPVAFQSGLDGKTKCKLCVTKQTTIKKTSVLNKNTQSQKSFLFSAVKF